MNEKIKTEHLQRAAYVYVRQSTVYQVPMAWALEWDHDKWQNEQATLLTTDTVWGKSGPSGNFVLRLWHGYLQ